MGMSNVEKAKWASISLPLIALLIEALLRYVALSSNVFDFGLFANAHFNVWQVYQLALGGHVQGFFPLFAGAYNTLSSPIAPFFLIIVQWTILASSVLLAWRYLGFIPSLAIGMYYPFWAVGLFDFHFDCLVILILLVFFILCDRRHFWYASAVVFFWFSSKNLSLYRSLSAESTSIF